MHTRIFVLICLVTAILCLGIGVIIGYFVPHDVDATTLMSWDECDGESGQPQQAIQYYLTESSKAACTARTCDLFLPRNYVTYHLGQNTLTIDGDLDDDGWSEISWTEDFVDLRGTKFGKPRFRTRVKIRWDNNNIYIGAELEEPNIWANKTEDETLVWQDNAFEIYADVDRSTHNYKELQVNALNTTWDLLLTKAYMDGGQARSDWDSAWKTAVSIDGGPINDATATHNKWTVEISIPFVALTVNTTKTYNTPRDKDIWRIVLARPEWKHEVVNGVYVKHEDNYADWWSWVPHGGVALHIPDRWGLLQFSTSTPGNVDFTASERWPIYSALTDTFHALHNFKATYDGFTNETRLLDLPPYLLTENCVKTPQIRLATETEHFGFIVSVTDGTNTGHIRADRFTWFGDITIGEHRA